MTWELVLEKLLPKNWFSPRFMCFVLIVCTALFFMPDRWASYLSVDHLIAEHRGWWGLGIIGSLAYLVPFGLWPVVERRTSDIRAKKKIAARLSNLVTDEKRLLRRFYFPPQGHLILWQHEVGKLEFDGIVFRSNPFEFSNKQQVFSVTDVAAKYINEHPELLAELERTPHP